MTLPGTVNGDKRPPELEAEVEVEVEEEEQEEQTALLRKTFRQDVQSNISTTDSDDMYSEDSAGLKFVIRDDQGEGTGFSNGSSRLEVDGDHHVIYEVSPADEIEVVTTRETGAQNGATVKFQLDQIPLTVANPISNGAIKEQTSYYTSLDNGTTENKRVDFRTENGNEVADLYLERIYEKPSSHNFYCPNCQSCITKVIIRDREWVNNTVSAPVPTQDDKFRCTSCLSFLVPLGIWLFPNLASREEEVSSGQGTNVENIGIRERETLQVSQETRDHQQSPVDRATVPDRSVGYAVRDKNKVDHAVTPAHPSLTSAEGRIAQENTVYSEKVFPDQPVGNAVADQTQKSDSAEPNSRPTHPSLQTTIAEVVPDKGVNNKEGNMVESIIVGKPQPLQESAETMYDQGIQAASINKPQAPDQLVEIIMWMNEKDLETKIDSAVDSSVIDGAEDSKKGNAVENIVVGIPYPSHETNGSMLDIDSQASTVDKAQVPNQSNGFAVLLESEIETKAKTTPGLTSLEAMIAETVTDTLDAKKGIESIDVENVVVGIPYPSQEPKGGLLDRFSLSALINKAPVPDQSDEVGKTELLKTPEPVVATVPDASPVPPSLGTGTTESISDSAVNSREGLVAIPVDDSLDEQVGPEPSRFNSLEVLKSIVYGGLAESITSLGIVASAASADTATGNIVALALANLISGLFILGHNLAGLKKEQFSRASSNETDDQQVDRYEDVLGNRENYILHFTITILSFLVFGLVPPLVYGFSFTKSNDKDLKLAAVAGASLLCVIFLAVVKAHIRRPNGWDVYVKSVVSYVAIAAGAGGLSYLAGDLINKLIKEFGWFEQSPAAPTLNLSLPGMSLAKPSWASY